MHCMQECMSPLLVRQSSWPVSNKMHVSKKSEEKMVVKPMQNLSHGCRGPRGMQAQLKVSFAAQQQEVLAGAPQSRNTTFLQQANVAMPCLCRPKRRMESGTLCLWPTSQRTAEVIHSRSIPTPWENNQVETPLAGSEFLSHYCSSNLC